LLLTESGQQLIAAVVLAGGMWLLGRFALHSNRETALVDYSPAVRQPVQFVIDINRASWPEFAQLPGVGETLARRIVAHRQKWGEFTSVEQLGEIPGIGNKTLARMRTVVVVRPTKLMATAESEP
jgi:competence protein ComEA